MAGRIPQTFIDDVLSRVDIVDIVDSRVKLKKTGRNYSACCPFHQEKTPSFTVSPDKQFYYCFGCGANGNALGFIMEFEHLDFSEAINQLADQLGMDVPREQNNAHHRSRDYRELYELMSEAARFYETQLRKSPSAPEAIQYLKGRGLDGHTCKAFGIGFAPPGWSNLQNLLARGQDAEDKLLKIGMLIENNESKKRYDRFRDRIMFPIRDSRGRIIAFGGRVLGDSKPKYLNSPESPIFHKGRELYGLYEAKKQNRTLERVIVVEGYMDVVALAQLGISYAVATLGTATTLDHVQRLFKMVKEVVFCFDGDEAGQKAAWRAMESTLPNMRDGKQTRFLFLPQGEDPDSIVRSEGKEAFLKRISSEALSLDNFLFRELNDGLDLKTMDGRARLAELARPYLNKLPDSIFKKLVLKKLSDMTGLDSDTLAVHMYETSQPSQSGRATDTVAGQYAYDGARSGHDSPLTAYDLRAPSEYLEGYVVHEHVGQRGERLPYSRIPDTPWFRTVPEASAASIKIGYPVYAIRHLLCNPRLAEKVDDIHVLEQDESLDTQLLVELLKELKQRPELSTIALIAQWHGTGKGIRLQQVASLELGHEPDDNEFWEAVARIQENINRLETKSKTSQLLQNIARKKPGQFDQEDKKEYQALLKKLQDRIGLGAEK